MKKIPLILTIVLLTLLPLAIAGQEIKITNTALTEYSEGIQGTYTIANTGDETSGCFLVEQQILTNPFATVSTNNQACDLNKPFNVHKEVCSISAGKQITVTLQSPVVSGTYYVKGVSVDTCCVDKAGTAYPTGTCSPVANYGWGVNLGKITVDTQLASSCGDDICSSDENALTCKADCTPFLGDGVCTPGELYPSEPACEAAEDQGQCNENGVCELARGESYTSCADCPVPSPPPSPVTDLESGEYQGLLRPTFILIGLITILIIGGIFLWRR